MAIIYNPAQPYQPVRNTTPGTYTPGGVMPGSYSPGGGMSQPTGLPYSGSLGGSQSYGGQMSRAGAATQSYAGGFGSYSRFGTHNGFYGNRFSQPISPGGGNLFGNYANQNQQQYQQQPYPNANQFQGNGGWPFVFQSAPQPFVQPRSG